jgi:CYTH domain-containing protein
MSKEIEKKFLVSGEWRRFAGKGKHIIQGYLTPLGISASPSTIRVRIINGQQAFLTMKSNVKGLSREEIEFDIPLDKAKEMLNFKIGSLIEKTRYDIPLKDNLILEVDVFEGDNLGLVLAEIELKDENQQVELPSFLGKEVSFEDKYFNVSLVSNPYQQWSKC